MSQKACPRESGDPNILMHENYRELIWMLAKTDFKLRYHGSVLGYVWAILKPLLMFLILNFVFSSIFNPRNTGTSHYSLQLLTSIMLFNFFAEGTMAGLNSFIHKSQLITKIYVPRWTIVVAATLNSFLIFLMNLVVIALFFAWYRFLPSGLAVLTFLAYIVLTYLLILGFSFIAAPLYARFRDLSQIWEVIVSAMFYATPIVYPLSLLPQKYHPIILVNPIGYIVHFTKMALTENHYASPYQNLIFVAFTVAFFLIGFGVYRKMEPKIAENI
ncbi:MAG: ABC transporter permease [Candidatus Moranbacteria bacterium]|nr:ABC transporter permease [Candidatus Moranbacteria bacterium]